MPKMREPESDRRYVFGATPMLANHLQMVGNSVTGVITFKQWLILLIVREMPVGSSVTEIARQHGSTRQNTMKLLRELSQQGYLEIRQAETDKRSYAIFMTDEGQATMERISKAGNAFVSALFDGISSADITATRRTITRLLHNLDAIAATTEA
ncbi:MAG: MarR family transcriptional regulator [Coriobacteriia bacterium]|nr:MarR family transcriptional regulator [Coriobacteriia bacterium]